MRLSLPCVRVGDNRIRFINCSFQNGSFTVPNEIQVSTVYLVVVYNNLLVTLVTQKIVVDRTL